MKYIQRIYGKKMRLHTRWIRVNRINILNKRFFDGGECGLGFFYIVKAYKCKEYCKNALALDYSHWFSKAMIVVKTDSGLIYKIPWCPWAKVYDSNGKGLSEYYNEQPW